MGVTDATKSPVMLWAPVDLERFEVLQDRVVRDPGVAAMQIIADQSGRQLPQPMQRAGRTSPNKRPRRLRLGRDGSLSPLVKKGENLTRHFGVQYEQRNYVIIAFSYSSNRESMSSWTEVIFSTR